MKTIWKYPFEIISDEFIVKMPQVSKILQVEIQDDTPCMWVLVDPSTPLIERTFKIFGTGHPINDDYSYDFVKTFQQGTYVWHLFKRWKPGL